MKKVVLILLVSMILLSGCYTDDPIEEPVVFYYIPVQPMVDADFHNGVPFIRPEVRDGSDLGTSLAGILTAYLRGPVATGTLTSPFPAGTYLFSTNRNANVLQITMSGTFAELTGLDLTIGCVCLAKTCMELTDAETVQIRANGALLDGAEYIQLDAASIELLDEYIKESE